MNKDTCPGCGSPIRTIEGEGTEYETIIYTCGTGEDSGYFGRECWANQCSQAQARIQELEGLVREMGGVLEQIRTWSYLPVPSINIVSAVLGAERIMNLTLVKEIMEKKDV